FFVARTHVRPSFSAAGPATSHPALRRSSTRKRLGRSGTSLSASRSRPTAARTTPLPSRRASTPAVTRIWHPVSRSRSAPASTARSTALAAVLDPSVPTRILLNTRANLARSLLVLLGRARLREFDRRRFDAFDRAEDDVVVLGVHDDRDTGGELLPQDPLGE